MLLANSLKEHLVLEGVLWEREVSVRRRPTMNSTAVRVLLLRAGPIPGPATLDQEHIPCRSIAYYEVALRFLKGRSALEHLLTERRTDVPQSHIISRQFSCWVLDCQSLIAGRMKR